MDCVDVKATETPRAKRRKGTRYGMLAKMWPIVVVVVVCCAPMLTSSELTLSRVEVSLVYLIAAMSLNFAYGFAGQLALGEPIIIAVGAYGTGLLSVYWGIPEWVTLPAAALFGAAVSLLLGLPSFRIRGWYFAILTFFGISVVPQLLATFGDVTGGLDGLVGIEPIAFGDYVWPAWLVYEIVAVAAILCFLVFRNAVNSGFGISLAILRDHPVAARACGLNLVYLKVRVYLLVGISCGVAGSLFARSNGVISPNNFDFNMILILIGAVFLGGIGKLWGPILGICFFQGVSLWIGPFSRYNPLILGLGVLVSSVVFRGGILAIIERFTRSQTASGEVFDGGLALRGEGMPASGGFKVDRSSLSIDRLSVTLGGSEILSDVSIDVGAGKIVSLIGPNGSGKTTLLNAVSGFVKCGHGSISISGDRVDGLPVESRARKGLGRTFQVPRLIEDLSILDNIALGIYGRSAIRATGAVFRVPSYRRRSVEIDEEARLACGLVGLDVAYSGMSVRSLPLGLKRITEVARAVASECSVLCLDEPAAGLNGAERDILADTLKSLAARGVAILLIEHNLDFVRQVSDEMCLLSAGKIVERAEAGPMAVLPVGLQEFFGRFAGAVGTR